MNSSNHEKQQNTKLVDLVDLIKEIEQKKSKSYPKYVDSKVKKNFKGYSFAKNPRREN